MKNMALELDVSNSEEFEELVKMRDFRISKALVDTVLNNLNGKKRHYHALTVNVEEEMVAYDITIDRDEFGTILQNNLKSFEINEEYEVCSKIVKALSSLKSLPPKKRGRPKKVEI
jgi:hypothetical protein